MALKQLLGLLLIYTGAFAGTLVGVTYLLVPMDWPLLIYTFGGVFLVLYPIYGSSTTPAPRHDTTGFNILSEDLGLLSTVVQADATVRLAAIGLGFLLWSTVLIAIAYN